MVQIHRQGDHIGVSDVEGEEATRLHPQFILALTDTWTLQGQPVEWGMEPIMAKLRSMDSWREDTILDSIVAERERREASKAQTNKNEFRARAYDLRKEFAEATNDINTTGLSRVG